MSPDVRRLLKRVSRSLYLSLRVLPAPVREAMGLGYLFCRAADTIADTRAVPVEGRLDALERYRAAFDGGPVAPLAAEQADAAERELMARLPETIEMWKRQPAAERALLRDVVFGVIDGMRMDLSHFQGELRAFDAAAQLDRYCGFIGGAPGRFWTDLCLLRIPELRGRDELRDLGYRLGQGLQITNILRDLPKDLRIGRCYLPAPELREAGLAPADLLEASAIGRLRPVLRRWLRWGVERLDAGAAYVEAMPGMRLRAAVAWPLLLALQTLARVAASDELLEVGRRVKVSRGEVYAMLLGSPRTLSSTARFRRRFDEARDELVRSL